MNSQKPLKNNRSTGIKDPPKKRSAKNIIILFLMFILGTTVTCVALLAAMSDNGKKQP